jgi:mannosyltransferase
MFATCAAIRLVYLDHKPFWTDECFSVEIARLDWSNFLHLLWSREANMALYYLLLRVWLHFGHGEFFVRSFSVLISAATVPAIYWLARQLYDRRVAWFAAALFTFNAYSVRYAQEARSYALFVLLATLSSGFLIAFLRQPTRRNLTSYILMSTLAAYAHFYALLLIAAQWLAFRWLGFDGEDSRLRLRRARMIILAAVSPLLIFVIKTGTRPILWIPRPSVHDLFEFFEHLAGGTNWVLPVLYVVAGILAIVPLGSAWWRRRQGWDTWRTQFLVIWIVSPFLLTALLSFGLPVFLPRYLIFCLPALVILGAAGIANVSNSWLRSGALGALLLASLPGIFFVYNYDFDQERDASGAATNFILDHSRPGDGIVLHFSLARAPYEFFRSRRARESSSASSEPSLGPEILYPRHADGLDYHDFRGVPTAELLRKVVPGHARLWVMLMYTEQAGKTDPATEMLTRVLPEFYPRVQRWQFPKVEVRLYSTQ